MPDPSTAGRPTPASPMLLADRLLTLAEDAARAGLPVAASRLLALAHDVLDEPTPSVVH